MSCFEKGSDLTVYADGRIVGGVLSLERTAKREDGEIFEFLTEIPVAVLPRERYYIKMTLHRTADYPFAHGIGELAVRGGGRTERYALCTVIKEESRAAARGETEYTLLIEARERSVANE